MKDDRTKHFKIRLTPEVHRLVRLAAADKEKSMQEYLEEMISAHVPDQFTDK
jgi:predicted HicB family RNase H-like nuclease